MRLDSILTIMDKPKHPQVALRRSLQLQALCSARVEAVSFCWQSLADAEDVLGKDQREAIRNAVLEERRAWQQQCIDAASRDHHDLPEGKLVPRAIWTNDIADWTTRTVIEQNVDLVVKSVHYSKTLLHTPLDWQLLRSCEAPILLTTARRRKTAKVVLAALDLSHLDSAHQRLNDAVLKAATTFAALSGAEVHCAYVIELSEVLRDLDIINAREARKQVIESVAEAMDKLLKPHHIPESRTHFPIGKVGQSLQFLAGKLKAELLVIGTAAHRVRQTLGLGNSAERALSRAYCDVLAVHP